MASQKRTPLTEEEKAAKRAYNRAYRNTPRGAASFAWNRLTSRAGGKYGFGQCYEHVEVRLDREEFMIWAIPEYKRWFAAHPVRNNAQTIPSVDRIRSEGHYELGNLRLVSWSDNVKAVETINSHAPEGTKWCPDCEAYRPHEDFYYSESTIGNPLGLSAHCKSCTSKRAKSRRVEAREEVRAKDRRRRKDWRSTIQGAITVAWHHLMERSEALRMARAEFIHWAMSEYQRWFAEHDAPPTVKRINPRGLWELGNLMLVPQEQCRSSVNREAPEGTRFCPACETFQPLDNFYCSKAKGPFGYCKPCAKAKRSAAR